VEWHTSGLVLYLTNRIQYVNVNDVDSSPCNLTHGVPQESVLGSLLFLIFINYLPNSSAFLKFNLFADDSTLSCKFSKDCINEISDQINLNLCNLDHWLSSNEIKINTNKTNYIIFSYSSNVPVHGDIKIGEAIIHQTETTKCLGVHLDQNLRFHHHIEHISIKISKSIGILNKLKFSIYQLISW